MVPPAGSEYQQDKDLRVWSLGVNGGSHGSPRLSQWDAELVAHLAVPLSSLGFCRSVVAAGWFRRPREHQAQF